VVTSANKPSVSKNDAPAAGRLRINEIFLSLQGETRTTGLPTVFVRLTGCPLRCGYCDTAYAFHEGTWMELGDVVQQVATYGARYVTVTGGEPLAQRPCRPLLRQLCDSGFDVSLETSGAVEIADIDPRVRIVMDLKTPGSGEAAKNRFANIAHLKRTDEVKFVISDRADYEWSRDMLHEQSLPDRCEILFSPAYGELEPRMLADWVLADRLQVRVQIQLHKLLWGEERAR